MQRWSVIAVAIAACSGKQPGPPASRVENDVAAFFEPREQEKLGERMICGGESFESDRFVLVGKPVIRERDGNDNEVRVRVRMTVSLAATNDRLARIGTKCEVTRDLYYSARDRDWRFESWSGVTP